MTRHTIGYQPALDGVRALAVLAVLVFHGGVSWMSGGYLGVSTFFTLSGFLITSLLLAEHSATGKVAVGSFYTRRARRLLPASLVCLALVCVLAGAGSFDGLDRLRRDVLGALFQVFNWVKLGSGESYADLTASQAGLRRPLDHYWSLAIEEQFYWMWPLAFLGIMWWCRRRGITPLTVIGVMVAMTAAAAPLIAQAFGPDAAYWSTPARISEILVGALIACVVAAHGVHRRASWLAPVCLVALTVACVLFPADGGPAYRGALPLVGVASAGLIYGLQAPGRLRSLLSLGALVAIGRVSYGLYLFHWPVYVLVDRQQWDLPTAVSLAVKLAITGVLVVVSYVLIERPVRTATWLGPRRTLVGAAGAMALVGAMVLLVPASTKYYGVDAAAASAAAIGTDSVLPLVPAISASPPTSTPVTTPAGASTGSTVLGPTTTAFGVTASTVVPSRPVRILVVGDSTAEATGAGLVAWAAANPTLAQVQVAAGPGCGLALGGFLIYAGSDRDVDASCTTYVRDVALDTVERLRPDVVMVMSSVWDVLDRRLEPGAVALPPTDPQIATFLATALADFTDQVIARGAQRVVWIREPVPQVGLSGRPNPENERARHEVMWRIIDDIAAARSQVRVVDLAGWTDQQGYSVPGPWRPDGVHWSPDVSLLIAEQMLGPELIRMALT